MTDWSAPNVLDRNQRGDLAARWSAARVIEVAPGPMVDHTDFAEPGTFDQARCFYLGDLLAGPDRQPVFARWVDHGGADLRKVMESVPQFPAHLLFAASALVNWHAAAQFCAVCGGRTQVSAEGWSRTCSGCGQESFPRTDPAVIVAVRDADDRLLLGRQPVWAKRRMSVFAGFVEAGESLEQAVHREVFEEVGLSLEDVRYFGSQPWPFPRSLMLGFTALAKNTDFQVGEEIETAHWVTRSEFTQALEDGTMLPPSVHSIAYRLIQAWLHHGR